MDIVSKIEGVSAHTEMPFFNRNIAAGVLLYTAENPLRDYKSNDMNRKVFFIRVSLCQGYKVPKLVRVKAHKRICNGMVVKVRSHYRFVVGR